MKKLLVILFSIFALSSNATQVYYCYDDGHIGFKTSQNYEKGTFPGKKFTVMIDFDNKKIISEEISFDNTAVTKCVSYSDNLYCINDYGKSFSFNKKTSKFMRSSMINIGVDDVSLAHGMCEKY
jgi:hypothetical protein